MSNTLYSPGDALVQSLSKKVSSIGACTLLVYRSILIQNRLTHFMLSHTQSFDEFKLMTNRITFICECISFMHHRHSTVCECSSYTATASQPCINIHSRHIVDRHMHNTFVYAYIIRNALHALQRTVTIGLQFKTRQLTLLVCVRMSSFCVTDPCSLAPSVLGAIRRAFTNSGMTMMHE